MTNWKKHSFSMATEKTEQFVSEEIKAVTSTANTSAMGHGEPGLPSEFLWKKKTLHVNSVLRNWREKSPCTHSTKESYLRKHWYEVELENGARAKLYFERNPRAKARNPRWWLFSIESPPE